MAALVACLHEFGYSLVPVVNHAVVTYGGVVAELHAFLTAVLSGSEKSGSPPP